MTTQGLTPELLNHWMISCLTTWPIAVSNGIGGNTHNEKSCRESNNIEA